MIRLFVIFGCRNWNVEIYLWLLIIYQQKGRRQGQYETKILWRQFCFACAPFELHICLLLTLYPVQWVTDDCPKSVCIRRQPPPSPTNISIQIYIQSITRKIFAAPPPSTLKKITSPPIKTIIFFAGTPHILTLPHHTHSQIMTSPLKSLVTFTMFRSWHRWTVKEMPEKRIDSNHR